LAGDRSQHDVWRSFRASGTGTAAHLFAVEDLTATMGLRVGQSIFYGTLDYGGGVSDEYPTLRYDAQSERRFERLQTPSPAYLGKRFQRNSLFDDAQKYATLGDFLGALNDLAEVVVLDQQDEGVGDLDEDEANLERCRAMAERVWAGQLPAATMSAQCVRLPSRSV
jgi:hypothetical protein